jgi:hypothetical protein
LRDKFGDFVLKAFAAFVAEGEIVRVSADTKLARLTRLRIRTPETESGHRNQRASEL